MIFFHPIWFFAFAAIGIPVAIHLWNVRKGKTLKIGSIALITAASQKRSLSRRLNDLLLLFLRCLWLILLAFTLAMPLWKRNSNSAKAKGWVLIPKESVKEAYQKFKPKIDSLTKTGFEFHYFNANFAKADINKAVIDTVHYQTFDASYWTLIHQLDGQIMPSLPVYLFTSNGAAHFNGEKPQAALNLHWQTYTSADSVSRWIQKAWLMNNGDIQIVEGNSNPNGTFYKNYAIRSGDQSTGLMIRTNNGTLSVGLKNSNEQVPVDTTTWRFLIYADKHSPGVGYLKAALLSVIQFTKHKALVKQYVDANQMPAQQNWLFWLSAKPINKQLQYSNLFIYENGKVDDDGSWIVGNASDRIDLYRSITVHNKGFAVWKDGFGNPVLSLEHQAGKNLYHFYSRFDPSWSDLVWSDQFPKMLFKLIVGPVIERDKKYDKRMLSDRQIIPVMTNERISAVAAVTDRIDLSRYIWLLLALIFFAERWLANRSASKPLLKNG